ATPCYQGGCLHPALLFFTQYYGDDPHLSSFPTRRSSDLSKQQQRTPRLASTASTQTNHRIRAIPNRKARSAWQSCGCDIQGAHSDRKSTRLNSSHVKISYAVFRLKKKNNLSAQSLYIR